MLVKLDHSMRNGQIYKKRLKRVETKKRVTVKDILDNLFDGAPENVLNILKDKENIQFLSLQRKKGQPGSMDIIDLKYIPREGNK